MDYQERLENVSVLGAAGKMGSGIVLLLALEIADWQLNPENRAKKFVLNAIDLSQQALSGLVAYLRAQVLKQAEKNIVQLRKLYSDRADLIENADIIRQYVSDVVDVVRPVTAIESAYESNLIFEGVNEDEEMKVKLFRQIEEYNRKSPWYFSNTSSIPIGVLNDKAGLDGRIIGFHFYNPPAVQKLAELTATEKTRADLVEFAVSLATNLRKTVVRANDFAGFIGNGHFIRDILHALSEAENYAKTTSLAEALIAVNRVSQDFLIRPMGICQLIDYVGVDVCVSIMKVMQAHFPKENLQSPYLQGLRAQSVRGGQNPDGSQRDGIFKYERNRISGVYDSSTRSYLPVAEVQARVDARLGGLPTLHQPWNKVMALPERQGFLARYFAELKTMQTSGAELARRYAAKSKQIGLALVSKGIAKSEGDVNTVMLTGFYHAYGPINDFLE